MLQASAANAALCYHCCCAAIFDKKFHSHCTNIFQSIQTCVTGAGSIIQQNMCYRYKKNGNCKQKVEILTTYSEVNQIVYYLIHNVQTQVVPN